MFKHLTTALALILGTIAHAQVYLYNDGAAYHYGALNNVSANGRWAVGTDDGYQTGSYIVDTTQPDVLIEVAGGELYAVSNDGMAVGAWYDNQGTESEPINYAHAAVYVNGEWVRLPEPSNIVGQSYARAVSPDGRYIAGIVFCSAADSEMGGKYYPCLWTRSDVASSDWQITLYNNLALPGNMGFYVNDLTDDGRTLVGTLCTDAGGTVPAIVQEGALKVWNKCEWKEWLFGDTYYDAGFVDDMLEGAEEDLWFAGALNRINAGNVYGHRSRATNVNKETAEGRVHHFRTIYNLATDSFADTPSNGTFTYGFTPDAAFMLVGTKGYLINNGRMATIAEALGVASDLDIACVYAVDEARRVFACSIVWWNEVIAEYCEGPALIVLSQPLSLDAPTITVNGTSASPTYTLAPSNQAPLRSICGPVTLTFEQPVYVAPDATISISDGVRTHSLPLSLGDAPNQVACYIPENENEISTDWEFTLTTGNIALHTSTDEWQWVATTFSYTVELTADASVAYTVTPSLNQPLSVLEGTYTITLNDYTSIQWESVVIPCRVYIYKESGNTYGRPCTYFDATVARNTITFNATPRLYEAGNYFINLSGYVRSDGLEIPDINIPFTLTGGDAEEDTALTLDQRYTLSPDPSLPIYQLSGRIVITFPGIPAFADVGGFPTITTPSGEQIGLYADGTMLRVRQENSYDGSAYRRNAGYIDLDAAGLKFTEPGTYTFSIPRYVFHVDSQDYDKDYVDPFEFTYTIVTPQTVLFDEDFNADYHHNFPHTYEGDGLMPHDDISNYFYSSVAQQYMPWWVLRESATDPDRFMASHAYYTSAGQSDDWLISRAIPLPENSQPSDSNSDDATRATLMLEFDAQSLTLREGERLSDLTLYVTTTDPAVSLPRGEPTATFNQIPCGATPDVTTDEWTHYQLPLDSWAGKTIYLSFVNRNTDCDLLCIDNVRVVRNESIEVTMVDVPAYTADDEVSVTVSVTPTRADLDHYSVEWQCDGTTTTVTDNAPIKQGDTATFTHTFTIAQHSTATLTFRFLPEGDNAIERTASVTRLAFKPRHRVLIEETTGAWCGNCPIAIYNIEALKDDATIADDIIPVSIHISGGTDLMTLDPYADYLGIANVAPMTRIDRGANAVGFNAANDATYDPTNAYSFAHAVHAQRDKLALFDIDVVATPILSATDTVAFNCTAHVHAAATIATPSRYRVGFILTENNVGLDDRAYWAQHNYFSGHPFASQLGGWTEVPEMVNNVRYHYVARSLPYPSGIEGSFTSIDSDAHYTVTTRIDIPDTYLEDRQGNMAAPRVRPAQCEITAYIVDTYDLSIVNAARVPITDEALTLYTIRDVIADDIHVAPATAPQPTTIYDLQGRTVARPTHGIYIIGGVKRVLGV